MKYKYVSPIKLRIFGGLAMLPVEIIDLMKKGLRRMRLLKNQSGGVTLALVLLKLAEVVLFAAGAKLIPHINEPSFTPKICGELASSVVTGGLLLKLPFEATIPPASQVVGQKVISHVEGTVISRITNLSGFLENTLCKPLFDDANIRGSISAQKVYEELVKHFQNNPELAAYLANLPTEVYTSPPEDNIAISGVLVLDDGYNVVRSYTPGTVAKLVLFYGERFPESLRVKVHIVGLGNPITLMEQNVPAPNAGFNFFMYDFPLPRDSGLPINGTYLIAGEVEAQDGSERDTTPNVFTLTVTGFADRGAPSLASTVNLPRTGQTTCYDSKGSKVNCANTGQDGDIQAGVPWPTPRFTDNGDGTVTDNLTGLVWLKDANCFGSRTWQSALNTIADFNANPGKYNCQGYARQYTDWRLPNVNELESLVNAEKANSADSLNSLGFTKVQADWYWSSTTYAFYSDSAWFVRMSYGYVVSGASKDYYFYVWPMRLGR